MPKRAKRGVFSPTCDTEDILCLLSTHNPNNINNLPATEKDAKSLHGPTVANPPAMPRDETAAINPIGNAVELDTPVDSDLPDEYRFEIYRLRRRVQELEVTVREKDERIVRALGMLEDELQMWRTGMHDHVWETLGTLMRRIVRLESTLSLLKDVNGKSAPDLPIPERWQRKPR